MIKFKDIDVIVILANIAAVFATISYTILGGLSNVALNYAGAAGLPEESVIYVLVVFGEIFFIVTIWIIVMLDIFWISRMFESWQRKQDEGWL